MIMLTILALTVLVFASRYLFLEPSLPLKLGHRTQRFLSYASPAVLTAIWAPIVFIPEGELQLSLQNPYLLAALVAALIAWRSKNVLLTTIVSMFLFFILKLWVF
ncbi:branched-chain amino acid ABC transporter [Vibrio vulnificus]|uniref:AzlD domain-containing protein n=1 Tax=Vibrio vulnificus TaxID=672 RepID=UPI000543C92A|nr:AzlD domain-containing protein [Vibrio vulnificus]EGR0633411.1 AzlD domain-containing protein [Vibrio vulnificus]EHU9516910.1 AzlD domain-containing protein [Vibrio vulnificus]EID4339582.1 AzlD domain-containing protein [Vibrio vulnificus]EID4374606.1 AzlD domain-containing protein [Vibrio vulnificus]EIJ0947100.1 AzlD domain-containing protein [Vibrio vulnificus]